VLLKTDEGKSGSGWTDERGAEFAEVSLRTVSRVRKRFVEEGFEIAVYRKPLAAWMTVLGPEAFEDYEPAIEFVQTVMNASSDAVLVHKSMGGLLFRSGKYSATKKHLLAGIEN
jgi:hypothetical protein